ncbi:glycosyltransferase [Arthrobacter sp. PM3]|uniref:glycosyltransferase n=1 Tax=Arthrobacter sp. PM3 TaxID=2017685 RepID=UPI001ABFBCA4|nr:glycosyltransferase [Arthrobacter sp. PM3]
MLFIGQTRFSLFHPRSSSSVGAGSGFLTPEDYEVYLYSDERIGLRTDIFINQSLPQLALASKGFDLFHVVSYSAELPTKFQRLLEDAAERYQFLVLDRQYSKPTVDPHDIAAQVLDGSDAAYGVYQLDDDGVVSLDYFEQMSQYVTGANAGMQVSLATGITALGFDGNYSNFRSSYWPMHSMGLLSIWRRDNDGFLIGPDDAQHNLSDRTNPVIVDARKPGYFWVRHLTQDTSIRDRLGTGRAKLAENLQRYPSVSEDVDLGSIFPAIADRMILPVNEQLLDTAANLSEVPILYLDRPSSLFSLRLDAYFGEAAVTNSALVSLLLMDTKGADITDEVLIKALLETGIGLSGNRNVGFYRYLKTSPGRSTNSYEFALPEGVLCRGFIFQHWMNPETTIVLHSVDVFSQTRASA